MTFAEDLELMETIEAFANVIRSGRLKVLTIGVGTIYLTGIQVLNSKMGGMNEIYCLR